MTNPLVKDLQIIVTGSTGRLGREVMHAFDEAGFSSIGIDSAATVEFRKDGKFLHITPGTGTWGPPMRLGSRNQVTVIKLKPQQ